MVFLKAFVSIVNKLNGWVGKVISMLVFPMIGFLVWEVIMRYVFNQPTIWAHELSAILYAVFFLLGGAYTLQQNGHINVDILYLQLSPRKRAVLDLITWILFYFFCGVMLWEGAKFAWTSIKIMERASTVWEPPIWPVKICIPLGAFLILLQGLTKTLGDVIAAVTGRDLLSERRVETTK
jgi:TRAP-type mannitol/chloroaromatic compound transport system permease small subunit